jgi:hypothetical protein
MLSLPPATYICRERSRGDPLYISNTREIINSNDIYSDVNYSDSYTNGKQYQMVIRYDGGHMPHNSIRLQYIVL